MWANDISAELAADARSTDELMNRYKDDQYNWIVIAKQDNVSYGDKMLKVKSMIRGGDKDIRSSDLMSWLRAEIKDRDQQEGTSDRARVVRNASQPEGRRNSISKDVRVHLPQRKGKGNPRLNVIDAGEFFLFSISPAGCTCLLTWFDVQARDKVRDLCQGYPNATIAVVSLREDIFEGIRNTSLSDAESWSKLAHNAPATDREYINGVRELMTDITKKANGVTDSFIYNSQSGSCMHYDLARK